MTRRPFLAALSAFGLAPALARAAGPDAEDRQAQPDRRRMEEAPRAGVVRSAAPRRHRAPGTSPLLEEHRKGIFHCIACDLPLFSSDDQVRERHRLAELLRRPARRADHEVGPSDDRAAHRVPLRALRRPPGPCLRRRPGTHRQALLQQRRRAEVRRRLSSPRASAIRPRPSVALSVDCADERRRHRHSPARRAARSDRPVRARGADLPAPEPRRWSARIARYGAEEALAPGTLVFERGERSVDFFLVLDGAIEIFEHDRRRHSRNVLHGPWRAPVHRRARPVQRPPDPGLRPRRPRTAASCGSSAPISAA